MWACLAACINNRKPCKNKLEKDLEEKFTRKTNVTNDCLMLFSKVPNEKS